MSIGWMVRARRAGVGLVLVASLAAAGCDGSPGPGSSPTPTPSAASSSSSSSTATPSTSDETTPSGAATIPAAARENSAEGAEAFVRFFFDQYNEAWTQPRTGLISSLSDTGCEFCSKAEATSVMLKRRGDRYAAAPVTVGPTAILEGAPEPERYVHVALVQNASDVVAKDGSIVHSDPRADIPSNVAVKWVDGRWLVAAVEEA